MDYLFKLHMSYKDSDKIKVLRQSPRFVVILLNLLTYS